MTHKYHVGGPAGGTNMVLIDKGDDVPKTHYLHRDHLDSIVAITDDRGFVVERFHYDAFGNRRTAVGAQSESFLNTLNLDITDRGFTGHKILAGVDLIHMRGRVYDATIGRFLSADPHIQFAGHTQSYNRYSYVLNNPLAYTDPSGYFLNKVLKVIKKTLKAIAKIIKNVIKVVKKVIKFIKENLRMVIAIVAAIAITVATAGTMTAFAATMLPAASATTAAIVGAALTGALAGAVSGLIMTGSLKGMLKGAVIGFITGGAAKAIQVGGGPFQAIRDAGVHAVRTVKVITHGIIGGIRSDWNGGSWSKGFVTNAVGKVFSMNIQGWEDATHFIKGLATATAGGLTSKLVGGNFEDGFMAAGLAYAANQVLSGVSERQQETLTRKLFNRWRSGVGTKQQINRVRLD